MKIKILIGFFFTLFCAVTSAQTFQRQSLGGSPTTENTVVGAFRAGKGLVFTAYPDTLTANLDVRIMNEEGFAIKVNNILYLRDTLTHAWLKISSSATPGSHVDSVTVSSDSTVYILWQGANTLYFPTLLKKVVAGVNMFITYRGDTIVLNSSASASNSGSGLLQGGFVTHNTGYTYDVTSAVYNIGTGLYSSASGSITLATADATFDRIDVIGLDTSGAIIKVTGVASANPQLPQVNPLSQLALTSVLVKHGTTEPDNITRVIVYDENSEWSHQATLTPDFNNTINPFHLTKAINIAAWTTSPVSAITFTSPVKLNIADYNVLKFFISLKAVLPSNAFIFVALMNGTTYVTPYTPITTAFGLNSATSAYQNISVPFSALTITGTQWDRIQFYLYGPGPGMYLDYVQFQGGLSNGSSQYVTNVFRKPGTDSVFKTINGANIFAYRDSTGGSGTTPTLQQVLDVQHANAQLNKADTITLNGNQLNIGDVFGGFTNGIEMSPGQTVINAAYASTGDYAQLNITSSPGGQGFTLTSANGVGGSKQASISAATDPTTSQISLEASDLRLRSTLVGAANGYVWTLSDNSTGTGSWQPASGGGGSIVSVTGDLVDNTDPLNPVVGLTGTHTPTNDAIIDMTSFALSVNKTGYTPLQLTDGLSLLKSYDPTNDGRTSRLQVSATSSDAGFDLITDFDDGFSNVSISGVANASGSSLQYTADTHTFNGEIINNADSSTSPFNVVTIDENNVFKRAALPRLDTAYRSDDSLSLIFSYLGGAKDSFQFSGGISRVYAGGHLANTNDSTLNADTMAVNIYTSLASKVSSVSGTANRITSTGGTSPVMDISAAYVGQSSITTLGTVTTGTWNATPIATTYGGAGSGGTTGQVLRKNSNTNYDYSWATPSGGTSGISRILAGYGETLVNDSTTNVDSSVILNRARAVNEYLPIIGRTYTTTGGIGLNLTTSTLTSGNLVSFYSSGTAATGNNQTLVADSTYGANATSTQTTYAHRMYNVHTGTAATNVGLLLSASGGTNNYALVVPSGNVGIGNSAPSSSFKLDITGGMRASSGGGVSYALDQGSAIRGDASITQWYLDGNGSLTGQISLRATTFIVSAAETATSLTSNTFVAANPSFGYNIGTVLALNSKLDSTILRINDNSSTPNVGIRATNTAFSDSAATSIINWQPPHDAALVEIDNKTARGFLLPRLTSAQIATMNLTGVGPGLMAGGTGYTNGVHNTKSLTGGTGTGATAKITVAGGVVTSFSMVSYGTGFTVGDVLGITGIGAGSGFSYTIYELSGPAGLQVYCKDCTAVDASTGVTETWNGSVWKKEW